MEQNEKLYSQFGLKFWIISASVIVVIAGLREAAGLITPLFLSIFITAIFYGPFKWLQDKEWHTAISLTVVIAGIAIIALTIIGLLGASVASFTEKIPFYDARLSQYWSEINRFIQGNKWLNVELDLSEYLNPAVIMKFAGNIFTGFGNLMSNSFIILLVVIFMLLEISIFERKLKVINESSLVRVNKIVQNLNAYFSTKALTSLVTGFLVSVSLAIIGIDFPLLWGFLAFLLNFIPNIGSIIAAVPVILLGLIQAGFPTALAVAIAFLLINIIIGNVIEPRLMGKNLGLSPLIVFLSLIFWGWVLGTVGMLLATHLTMTSKLFLTIWRRQKKLDS